MKRAAALLMFAMIPWAAPARAATAYLALTPGASTQADAAKVLGPPVLKLADVLHEHKPQDGTGPIYVEYRLASDLIDRIEVKLTGVVNRADLIAAMRLPANPVATKTANGSLREYFGEEAAIAFAYVGDKSTSGVTSISYESDQLFERDVARATPWPGNDVPPPGPSPAPSPSPQPTPAPAPGPGPTPRPAPQPGPAPEPPPPPAPPAPPPSSTVPPSIKRNPAACYDVFVWADAQEAAARKSRQITRQQRAMSIRLAAQAGDCDHAHQLTDQYKKDFQVP